MNHFVLLSSLLILQLHSHFGFGNAIVLRFTDDIPLIDAIKLGNATEAIALINGGADVNAENENKETPLHWAARFGNMDLAELLIKNGANVDAKDENNGSPLHYAADWGHKGVAKLLIENGADVTVKNNNGKTPIQLASNDDMRALLLKYA